MRNYQQEAPFTIQVELTLGCNIKVPRKDGIMGLCYHCGLNAIRSGPGDYKFMTVETAEIVAKRIQETGWNSQLLFAMRGEPSMNPHFVEIIKIFRRYLPKAYMVMLSNGAGFIREGSVEAVMEAGLNTLAIEKYEGAGLYERVKYGKWQDRVISYPKDKEGNPHTRSRHQRVVLVDDIHNSQTGTHKTAMLNNHAGNGLPPNKNGHGKKCAKPFREVVVQYDGTVPGCCILWRNELEVGSVRDSSLSDLWQGDIFSAMRRILIKGERDKIDPCSKCDHPSFRVGLLPDKYGQVKLPDYTEEDIELLKRAKTKKQVNIVLRSWEKQKEC